MTEVKESSILIQDVETKNIMTKSTLPVGGYSVNPYVGCTHGCKYCYASFMKRFTGHTEPWGTFLDVKHWPAIKNPRKYAGQRVVIGSVTDGYLPQEEQFENTRKLLEQLKNDRQKHQYSKANPHGKMTVKQLAAKDKGLQSIEVTDQNIGSFNRIARKYGIDFAPFKVKGEKRYMVFFKAPDADAMTAAFKEYTAKQVRKAERPSVLEKLQHFKSLIQAAVVDRTKRKELER